MCCRHPNQDRGYSGGGGGYDSQGGGWRDSRPSDRVDSVGGRGPPLDRDGVRGGVQHPQNDRLGAPSSDRLGPTSYTDGHGGFPGEHYDGYHGDGHYDRYGHPHPLPPDTAPLAPGSQNRDYYPDHRANHYPASRNYTAEDDFHSLRQRYDEEY